MPLIEPIIRPPAEAQSFLLQTTTGCSANTCTFCGAYQRKPFRVLPLDTIRADIEEGARRFPDTRRVFLLDGDAFVLPADTLARILDDLIGCFPRLTRVAAYANGHTFSTKTDDELCMLAARKLTLVYMGLESGNQKVLDRCRKRARVEDMVNAVRRAQRAGIKSSVIVLLGLGGREGSLDHARQTALTLNRMQPRYLSFLSLMLIPGTPLYKEKRQGSFQPLSSHELLEEMREIIRRLDLRRTVFRSDHASNHLPLEGRFPQDKERLCTLLDDALAGKTRLRPEFLRGL